MGPSWIEHKGKRILFVDYRGCTDEEESLKILREEIEIDRQNPAGIRMLVDYTGATASPGYMAEVKQSGKEIRNNKVEKIAVLGIEGLKKVLFAGYLSFTRNKNIRAFENDIEAKAWLVE